jgi:hypothetical protein
VINDKFGIVEGLMTTVHSTTGTYFNLFLSYLQSAEFINGFEEKTTIPVQSLSVD